MAFVVLQQTGRYVTGRELDRALAANAELSSENKELRQRLLDSVASRAVDTEAQKEIAKVLRDVVVVLEVKKAAGS